MFVDCYDLYWSKALSKDLYAAIKEQDNNAEWDCDVAVSSVLIVQTFWT